MDDKPPKDWVLTDSDKQLFETEVRRWASDLLPHCDLNIRFSDEGMEDTWAQSCYTHDASSVGITCALNWGPVEPDSRLIVETAVHEIVETFLVAFAEELAHTGAIPSEACYANIRHRYTHPLVHALYPVSKDTSAIPVTVVPDEAEEDGSDEGENRNG